MLKIQEQAEVFRLGMIIGIFEPSEAIAWADRVIGEEAKPDNAILEVSMAAGANTAAMVSLLRDAAGEHTPGKPRDVLFGILAQQLSKNQADAPAIAAQLKTLRSAYDAPDAAMLKAAELAGPFGHDDDQAATRALADFLAPYAKHAAEWRA
ncbi:MAG: hypothetical protein IT384_25655 [Deltaproteobacteria bacterium]|nr:hypothetical protein [Deltaproteobacteria bacterium]